MIQRSTGSVGSSVSPMVREIDVTKRSIKIQMQVGFCCLLCHHLLLSSAKKWPENSCALASNVQVGDNWSLTSTVILLGKDS
jgi:hypothetical protein